jgi:PTS system sucrose-specific IIC component
MGLHHMYNVIEAGMLSSSGVNFWMPIASAANFAQFGACLAVALKVHNEKTKSVALPSSLSASLGITEPAIFGVNFRYMKPFVCGMIGGACGALFAAGPWAHGTNMEGEVVKFGATVYGVTGIPGIPAVNNIPFYLIELVIAAGVAFALTWIVWKEETPETASASGGSAPAAAPAAPTIETEPGVIYSPVEGVAIPREEIPDPTFASGVLGDGVGINPANGIVVAPCDGEISSVAESKHAIGISSPDGMEMLIHVGVDTVAMNGTGFEPQVKEGDQVKAGQVLLKFSKEEIKKAGHPDTVVTLLTNSEDYEGFKVVKTGEVKQLDKIFTTK